MDYTGKKFFLLTILKKVSKSNVKEPWRYWLCRCDCGNEKIINISNIKSGKTKSCGCLYRKSDEIYFEKVKKRMKKNIKIKGDCWEWIVLTKIGYGSTRFRSKPFLAHRMSWIVFKGYIPNRMCVLHKCDNRGCVNPDHLFLGSQKDNIEDMFSKGRKDHKNEKHPGCKLDKDKILQIRNLLSKDLVQEKIAKIFGVGQNTISAIKTGKRWSHIT